MWPEQVAALESECIKARARMRSSSGLYEKLRREGARPGDLARARNDYLEKARLSVDLEARYFPIRDELDTQ